jgi:predicted NAD-dependent protein-ADP-ribosyltransferase YbiA (DUF1768 family)
MRTIIKDGLIVIAPQSDDDIQALAAWRERHGDHVFHLCVTGTGIELHDLGPRPDACREPINVTSNSADPIAAAIGNFTRAPFVLDGKRYVSVESFWQGLKFPAAADRARIAALDGKAARDAGEAQGYGATISYAGETIGVGSPEHWHLMKRACAAKFEQDGPARAALLATSDRPLTHKVRRDSRAIPGVIMADIWMRIRARLRDATSAAAD